MWNLFIFAFKCPRTQKKARTCKPKTDLEQKNVHLTSLNYFGSNSIIITLKWNNAVIYKILSIIVKSIEIVYRQLVTLKFINSSFLCKIYEYNTIQMK